MWLYHMSMAIGRKSRFTKKHSVYHFWTRDKLFFHNICCCLKWYFPSKPSFAKHFSQKKNSVICLNVAWDHIDEVNRDSCFDERNDLELSRDKYTFLATETLTCTWIVFENNGKLFYWTSKLRHIIGLRSGIQKDT